MNPLVTCSESRGFVAICVAGFLAQACGVSPVLAQKYPERPVRIVVNVSPGGGVDSIARLLGQHYSDTWGQSFVVDNRTGAGGSIGAKIVVQAAADGHTLLVSSGSVVTGAAVRPGVYDPARDLSPISRLTSSPYLVAASPATPAGTIPALIALAKSKPGRVSFASAGLGSITHLGAELLSVMADTPMLHVPYKGVAEAYPAVASGQVDWILGNPVSAMPLVKAGRLKAIAVTSAKRMTAYPEIPTVAEGGVAGFEVVGWYGLFAPAGTPAAVLAALQSEARKMLLSAPSLRRLEAEASEAVANTPQAFATEVRTEFERWRSVVTKRGIRLSSQGAPGAARTAASSRAARVESPMISAFVLTGV